MPERISKHHKLKLRRRESAGTGLTIDSGPIEERNLAAVSDEINLRADTHAQLIARDQLHVESGDEVFTEVEVDERADLSKPIAKPYSRRPKIVMLLLRLKRKTGSAWGKRSQLIPAVRESVSESWRVYIRRKLTPEELHERVERKRRKKLSRELTSEAVEVLYKLRNAMTRNGLRYTPKKGEGERFGNRKIQEVQFSHVSMSPEAIYFRIDVDKLPWGVSINDILDEQKLRDFSGAVGRRVQADYRVGDSGVHLIVERSIGTRGIPNHVKYADMLDWMPASHNSYAFPLGITSNSTPLYASIIDLPHMLIAGTTGGGKSNFLEVVLITLLRRNRPSELELMLIDLKGGMVLSHYAGVPHLKTIEGLPNGIAEKTPQVEVVMEHAIQEMRRRMAVIKNAGFSDIVDYNARNYTNKIPRLLIAFDEIATLVNLSPRLAKKITSRIIEIGNIGRAVGVHFIVATQYPVKKNVDTAIKAVLNAKAAFGCSTLQGSMTILGNGAAQGLSPAGRFVWQFQGGETEIQCPFLSHAQRGNLLNAIRTGHEADLDRGHDVTLEEIFRWALDNTKGYLSRDRLYDHFSARGITRAELDAWLKKAESDETRVGETYYKITPAAGSRPRQLVPLDTVDGGRQMIDDKF